MSDRNIIKLSLTPDFLASTEPTDYERAYYPLHAYAEEGDDFSLDDDGLGVTIETSLDTEDWLDRQDDGLFEDNSGFYQRYSIDFVSGRRL